MSIQPSTTLVSARHGHSAEIRVADLMTRSVLTLTATQSVPLAESMMAIHRVRHIPVVDNAGRVVGIVTQRDLLKAGISSLAPLSDDERSTLQLAIPVWRVMTTPVTTIDAGATAVRAARTLRERHIGCLPVVESDVLVGILTESDLLSLVTDSLSLERPAPPPWTMEHVMTRVPVTITPDTKLDEARRAMSRYGIHHLPVVEDGRPVAIVTERDLGVAEAIFDEPSRTAAAHVTRLLGYGRVHRVSPRDPVDVVARRMFHDRYDAVAVVEEGRLVGIFTAMDACRWMSEARLGGD